MVKDLAPEQLKRAVELLDVIVRPGDHNFGDAIEEAQALLGYERCKIRPKRKRSFYGIHRKKSDLTPDT